MALTSHPMLGVPHSKGIFNPFTSFEPALDIKLPSAPQVHAAEHRARGGFAKRRPGSARPHECLTPPDHVPAALELPELCPILRFFSCVSGFGSL